MKYLITLFLIFSITSITKAQQILKQQSFDLSPETHTTSPCLSPKERQLIKADLQTAIQRYKEEASPALRAADSVTFIWPVKQAEGFDYSKIYGIYNYVDHDPRHEGSQQHILDYTCGTRTYDLTSGYNHAGTDIFVYPFKWRAQKYNQVEIVAAAAGVIISKRDGNQDQSCSWNGGGSWNAIYILHDDGSQAWYGHMKKGAFTAKEAGDRVEQGEFLGVMASSGFSTGPHLHFEVYDSNGDLIDPYQGDCNPTTAQSWWQDQKSYFEPGINALLTHSERPWFSGCPNESLEENIFEKNCFQAGEELVVGGYFTDIQRGDTARYALYQPDSTLAETWIFTANYTSIMYADFTTLVLREDAMPGSWFIALSYAGQTTTRTFTVGSITEIQLATSLQKTQLCEGESVTLFPASRVRGNYRWNSGKESQELTTSYPGSYSLSITDQGNCFVGKLRITTTPAPEDLLAERFLLCRPDTLTIAGPSGFASYLWSTGDTTRELTVEAFGKYGLTVTDSVGCTISGGTVVDLSEINKIGEIKGSDISQPGAIAPYSVEDFKGSSYQWTVAGGQILTEEASESITVHWSDTATVGRVCVQEYNYDNCPSEPVCLEVQLNTTTGTEEPELFEQLTVSPNPLGSGAHLQLSGRLRHTATDLSWQLLDVHGRELGAGRMRPVGQLLEERLSLPVLQSGLYLLRLQGETGRLVRRVLIQ